MLEHAVEEPLTPNGTTMCPRGGGGASLSPFS